jgi:hypothetical protein
MHSWRRDRVFTKPQGTVIRELLLSIIVFNVWWLLLFKGFLLQLILFLVFVKHTLNCKGLFVSFSIRITTSFSTHRFWIWLAWKLWFVDVLNLLRSSWCYNISTAGWSFYRWLQINWIRLEFMMLWLVCFLFSLYCVTFKLCYFLLWVSKFFFCLIKRVCGINMTWCVKRSLDSESIDCILTLLVFWITILRFLH